MFGALDKDGSGELDVSEMQAAMVTLGMDMTAAQTRQVRAPAGAGRRVGFNRERRRTRPPTRDFKTERAQVCPSHRPPNPAPFGTGRSCRSSTTTATETSASQSSPAGSMPSRGPPLPAAVHIAPHFPTVRFLYEPRRTFETLAGSIGISIEWRHHYVRRLGSARSRREFAANVLSDVLDSVNRKKTRSID